MYKLALVVGHNSARQGAVSPHLDVSEWKYWSKWAQNFAALHDPLNTGWDVNVFYRSATDGYGNQIRGVYAATDAWEADATVELHFNSAANPSAYGCEMLSSGSRLSMALAAELQEATLTACYDGDERKSINRGIKMPTEGERGFMTLHTGRAPAVLVEPFFGSNRTDCDQWDGTDFAAALTHAVTYAFREHWPRKSLDDSRTMKAAKKQRRVAAGGVISTVGAGATLVVDALGQPETAVEAVQSASALSQYLPHIGSGLILLAGAAFIISRYYTDQIEEAREDDHERGLR